MSNRVILSATFGEAYTFRHAVAIMHREIAQACFTFTEHEIYIGFSNNQNCIIHNITINTRELKDYVYNIVDQNGVLVPSYNIGFDTTQLYQFTKSINRRDGLKIYLLAESQLDVLCIFPLRTGVKDANKINAFFLKIMHVKQVIIDQGSGVNSTEPNVKIQAKEFTDVCGQAIDTKCAYVEIIGYPKGIIFRGILSDKQEAFISRFGSFQQNFAASTPGPAYTPSYTPSRTPSYASSQTPNHAYTPAYTPGLYNYAPAHTPGPYNYAPSYTPSSHTPGPYNYNPSYTPSRVVPSSGPTDSFIELLSDSSNSRLPSQSASAPQLTLTSPPTPIPNPQPNSQPTPNSSPQLPFVNQSTSQPSPTNEIDSLQALLAKLNNSGFDENSDQNNQPDIQDQYEQNDQQNQEDDTQSKIVILDITSQMTFRIPITSVKAIAKFNNISPHGTMLKFRFEPGSPMEIFSTLGTYGSYAIHVRDTPIM